MQFQNLHFHSLNNHRRLFSSQDRFRNHRHTYYEIAWIRRGAAFLNLPGKKRIHMQSGDLIVIPPFQYHFEKILENTIYVWIGFRAPSLPLSHIPLQQSIPMTGVEQVLEKTVEEMESEEIHHPLLFQERLDLLMKDFLLLIQRAAFQSQRKLQKPANISSPIEASRAYMESNALEEMTMEQVARHHGYSLSHFETLFRRRFRETPKQFHQKCRLQIVQQLMAEGVRSPKILAEKLAFNDAAYFCRWFKKCSGKTPSEFIKKIDHGR
jgi:AraC-like DNA-binding protein